MRIAVTGGTGFVGRHLIEELTARGHEAVVITRVGQNRPASRAVRYVPAGLDDADRLADAFAGCAGVAHLAGINREVGGMTYRRVHVAATRNVVDAARRARVGKVLLLSFLRARPGCGSLYHESKWAAEEIVRRSGLDHAILKSGVIYGAGDHMLDHLSRTMYTFPVFGLVGFRDKPVRPVAVEDMARIIAASLTEGRLSRQTVSVLGPEEMPLGEAVRRVAHVIGRSPLMVRLPVWMHYGLAGAAEMLFKMPPASTAQVMMLSEGLAQPLPPCDELPADLLPRTPFTDEQIRRGLPAPGGFGWEDLRCCGA